VAHPASREITFAIRGPISRDDLAGLCDRVCALLSGHPGTVLRCDVTGVGVDAVTIDALARLQLGAQRQGCRVRLVGVTDELRDLVAFMGLTDVLVEAGSLLEPQRQPEQREQ
jgi:ABC-type transporter Mla MlaB component